MGRVAKKLLPKATPFGLLPKWQASAVAKIPGPLDHFENVLGDGRPPGVAPDGMMRPPGDMAGYMGKQGVDWGLGTDHWFGAGGPPGNPYGGAPTAVSDPSAPGYPMGDNGPRTWAASQALRSQQAAFRPPAAMPSVPGPAPQAQPVRRTWQQGMPQRGLPQQNMSQQAAAGLAAALRSRLGRG